MTATANKSLDVRAKQRLCLGVVWLLSAGLMAVSPHVISAVRFLVQCCNGRGFLICKFSVCCYHFNYGLPRYYYH